MSEESDKTERAEQAPETEATGVPETGADVLTKAAAEAADYKDRYLRTAAELENFRRRAEKERQDVSKFAIAAFARDALQVLDNLRRGLDSVSAEDRKANPALEALAAGMEMTEREMLTTLERHGIEKVDPSGQPFDHNFHQAMLEVEDASVPPGTVVQVLQAGYVLNGRLLRPALVGVAKGGSKEGAASGGDSGPRVQAPIANEDLANAPEGDGKGD